MTLSQLDAQTETFVARANELQDMIGVRLAALRQIVQRSASMAFGRETGLSDFDWMVVWMIGAHESLVAAELSDKLQRDKGQVSRAVSRLTAADVISRDHLRAPLRLTAYGRELFERIGQMIRARNETMLTDVTPEERLVLGRVIDKLFRGATELFETERRLQTRVVASEDGVDDVGARDTWRPSTTAGAPELIVPDLYMLLRLLRRSADLAYSRVTKLSNFDWRALSHIWMRGPLTLSDLIVSLDRNKSQVGRAVERLVAQDLVERSKAPGLASVSLSATAVGKAAFDRFLEEARRRHDLMVAELTAEERDEFASILDKLTQNALRMLSQERAIEAAAGRAGRVRAYASGD